MKIIVLKKINIFLYKKGAQVEHQNKDKLSYKNISLELYP